MQQPDKAKRFSQQKAFQLKKYLNNSTPNVRLSIEVVSKSHIAAGNRTKHLEKRTLLGLDVTCLRAAN